MTGSGFRSLVLFLGFIPALFVFLRFEGDITGLCGCCRFEKNVLESSKSLCSEFCIAPSSLCAGPIEHLDGFGRISTKTRYVIGPKGERCQRVKGKDLLYVFRCVIWKLLLGRRNVVCVCVCGKSRWGSAMQSASVQARWAVRKNTSLNQTKRLKEDHNFEVVLIYTCNIHWYKSDYAKGTQERERPWVLLAKKLFFLQCTFSIVHHFHRQAWISTNQHTWNRYDTTLDLYS